MKYIEIQSNLSKSDLSVLQLIAFHLSGSLGLLSHVNAGPITQLRLGYRPCMALFGADRADKY